MSTANDPFAANVLGYVADSAPLLAFCLDAEQRVRQPNHYARDILGEQVEGRAFASLLPDFITQPDIAALAATPEVVTLLTLATVTGMPESYRFRFYALDDAGVLALGSPDIREAARLQTTLLDLNQELNNRSRQLHQLNAELGHANRLKNQFLGMAAHDLRRPLNVITMYTEFVLAETGVQLSNEHQAFLRLSLSAAADMRRLIDGFLDLAVLESGRLQLQLRPLSPGDIISGALPLANLACARLRLTLIVDVADGPRTVEGDAGKLQQVVANLIDNAVEHAERGQRIWLSAHWQPEGLVITVRDEGAGIAVTQQKQLFDAFERGERVRGAQSRHAGLGLAIARMVVEAHRGRIWIDSQPGQGATVSFSLPAPPAAPGD